MLFDTSFLIDLQREIAAGQPHGASRFLLNYPGEVPWISLISWMEFAEGYPAERAEACRLFLSRFRVVAMDTEVAWRASRLSRELRQAGQRPSDHDVWVAATAIERQLTLVTRNRRHFERIAGLRLLTY